MGFTDDCKHYFGTTDLYSILDVNKDAKESGIKSAYRKLSLKVHPDRADDQHKDEATRKFQILHKIHYILSNKDTREPYDEMGIIPDDDSMESSANWTEYWRIVFPKITTKDIDSFIKKYVGSEEESDDLKKYYLLFEGDMNKIFEHMIGFEENRIRDLLMDMIENGHVPKYDGFVNESASGREKRKMKAQKEAKMAQNEMKKLNAKSDDDLVNAIQLRSKGNYDNMVDAIAAKYCNVKGQKSKGKNSKKSNKK